MGLALIVVIGVCLTSGYRGDTFLVIAAVAVSAVCDSMSDIVYGLLQQRERLDRIGQSMMLRGISSVILLAATIGSTGRVVLRNSRRRLRAARGAGPVRSAQRPQRVGSRSER